MSRFGNRTCLKYLRYNNIFSIIHCTSLYLIHRVNTIKPRRSRGLHLWRTAIGEDFKSDAGVELQAIQQRSDCYEHKSK